MVLASNRYRPLAMTSGDQFGRGALAVTGEQYRRFVVTQTLDEQLAQAGTLASPADHRYLRRSVDGTYRLAKAVLAPSSSNTAGSARLSGLMA